MSYATVISEIFKGFSITATVAVIGLIYAIPFAVIFGTLQYFARGWRQTLVTAIIEFWRSSPVIVLLYAFYYSFPAFGVYLSAIAVGSMVLGLNIGGYGSQSVRAALQALDKGQSEAGLALGLNRFLVLRLIELPQAIRMMIPTFINQAIQLVKGTALVSLITLTDMTFRAKEIAQTQYDPSTIYTALLISYFVVCYPITILGRHVEQVLGRGQGGLREF
jgi:polar amino acid transport system permease protein